MYVREARSEADTFDCCARRRAVDLTERDGKSSEMVKGNDKIIIAKFISKVVIFEDIKIMYFIILFTWFVKSSLLK